MPFKIPKTKQKPVKTKLAFSKKWDDYFLEFLILFLAITLGFFIENYRVELTNRDKEKDYIISMIQDAHTDKQHIAVAVEVNKNRERALDSLSHYLMKDTIDPNTVLKIYSNYYAVIKYPDFITPTSVTLQQLKSTGSMRLIKNEASIKAIIRYDQVGKKLENQQMYYESYQMNTINIGTKVINLNDLAELWSNKGVGIAGNLTLITKDKALITEFGNMVFLFKGIVNYYRILLQRMDKEADDLIQVLKREYDIDEQLKEFQPIPSKNADDEKG